MDTPVNTVKNIPATEKVTRKKVSAFAILLKRVGKDAYIDWTIGLVAFVILTLIFSWQGYRAYQNYGNDLSSSGNKQTSKAKIFDEQKFMNIIKKYDDRVKARGDVLNTYIGTSDPG